MKKLLIAVSLILSACTNPSSDSASPVEDLPINKSISSSNLTKYDAPLDESANLERIEMISSPTMNTLSQNIKLSNNSAAPMILDFKVITDTTIVVTVNHCPQILAPGKQCMVQLTKRIHNAPNGESLVFFQILSSPEILGIPVYVNITNSDYITPEIPAGSVLTDLSVEVPTFSNYVLGTRATRVASLTNTSRTKSIDNLSFALPQKFKLILNRCGTKLEPSKACSLHISYQGPEMPEESAQLAVSGSVDTVRVNLVVTPETYVTSYSIYSPPVPSSLAACAGAVSSSRTMTCRQVSDNSIVSNSFCDPDTAPVVITESPSGTVSVSVSGGSETYSCAAGSAIQTFVSRYCTPPEFTDSGSGCVPSTFIATYTTYSPPLPTLAACDAPVTSTRSIATCKQNGLTVANTYCTDPSPTVVTSAPAGNKVTNITNGTRTTSCPVASTVQTFVSGSCTNSATHEYLPNNISGACNPITYTPTYSLYSPEIPSNLVACDGTIVSNRTMICKRDSTGATVSNSFCGTDALASVSTSSPAGNKTVPTTGGSGIFSCPVGSTVMTFVSGSCTDSANYDYVASGNNGSCVLKYVATIPPATNAPVELSEIFYFSPLSVSGAGIGKIGTGATSTNGATMTPSGAAPISNTASTPAAVSTVSSSVPVDSQLTTNSLTVNVTSAGSISSCSSPYINFTSCAASSFSFLSGALKNIIGNSFIVTLNNTFNLDVPFAIYTTKRLSNQLPSGQDDLTTKGLEFNDDLYFGMSDTAGKRRLHKISKAGVITQVSNINTSGDLPFVDPARNFSADETTGVGRTDHMAVFNNELYFIGTDSSGTRTKLYKLNTSGQIYQVSNIQTNDQLSYLTNFNSQLYFVSAGSIYKVDSAGTIVRVTRTNGTQGDYATDLTVFNGDLYFSSRFGGAGGANALYKVTPSGIVSRVSNTLGTNGYDQPSGLTLFNGNLYFIAGKEPNVTYGGNAEKLFKLTPGGQITQISNLSPGLIDFSYNMNKAVVFGNEMYFPAQQNNGSGTPVIRLYKLTTGDVITQVVTLNTGAAASASDWPYGLVVYKDELFFSAQVFVTSPSSMWRWWNTYKISSNGKITRMLNLSMVHGTVFDGSLYFTGKGEVPGSTYVETTRLYKLTKSP